MDRLKGIKVLHEKYGQGTIISVDDSMRVCVCHDSVGKKPYPFPRVFLNKFLYVDNEDIEKFENILISLENEGRICGCNEITKYGRLLFALRKYGFDGLVHTTNFSNFISIIKSGYLMSRGTIEDSGNSFDDVALHDVLDRTNENVKRRVRFYYGFGTPTNFTARYDRPVILVFDEKIMNENDVIFCDGNAGSRNTIMTDEIEKAIGFNWHDIFERGEYGVSNTNDYYAKTRMRNAEFLYHDKISVNRIKRVYFYNDEIMLEARAILGENISEIECVVDESKFAECGGTK